jgi:hypothetical protein
MARVSIEKCLIIIIGISFVIVKLSYAQPAIPKEDVPKDTPPELIKEIENLYSPDALERAEAAIRLGWMGEKAAAAIPFLRTMLEDNTPIEWEYVDIPRSEIKDYKPFTPAEEAKRAIELILKDSDGKIQ